MIAIDWGTSAFRAYRLADDGRVLERRSASLGILNVSDGSFAATLESQVGDWLAERVQPLLMCGMIGSRQGWLEVPYANVPAGAPEIAAAMRELRWGLHRAWIVPGLSCRDADGIPDVMRGEETQIIGALEQLPSAGAWICLPGTHSKWVSVRGGRIVGFTTHMTGELFAVLRDHSILGRLMADGPSNSEAFASGVRRAQDAGGLLHHLFGTRALGLSGELQDKNAASYLSGLLIGHEIASVARDDGPVHLLGAPPLVALYQQALAATGRAGIALDPDAAVRGLWRLAGFASPPER